MRSKVILVCEKEFRDNSPIVGAFDYDYILPFIKTAQDIDLAQITGERLLNYIYDQINNHKVDPEIKHLIDEYIIPVVINHALARGLVFLQSKPDNSGLVRRNSQNGDALDMNEVSFLADNSKIIGQDYGNRLKDYLTNNIDLFPSYDTESKGEVKPKKTIGYTGGMCLGISRACKL